MPKELKRIKKKLKKQLIRLKAGLILANILDIWYSISGKMNVYFIEIIPHKVSKLALSSELKKIYVIKKLSRKD